MGLLDTEFGKRRLLSVEVPAIEKYNEGRDAGFKIHLNRVGGTLVLSYQLKPCHNAYRLETRLLSSYPTVPPETRILTPLKHCPHLLEGQTMCLWRQGSTRAASRFAVPTKRGWVASGTSRRPTRTGPASRARTRWAMPRSSRSSSNG